jgi:hypothetical protein
VNETRQKNKTSKVGDEIHGNFNIRTYRCRVIAVTAAHEILIGSLNRVHESQRVRTVGLEVPLR